MRLSTYITEDGEISVLVEASLGTGKPPVLLQGITKENYRSRVREAVEAQKRGAARAAP